MIIFVDDSGTGMSIIWRKKQKWAKNRHMQVYLINFNCQLFFWLLRTWGKGRLTRLRVPLQKRRAAIPYGQMKSYETWNGWSARGLLMTQQSISGRDKNQRKHTPQEQQHLLNFPTLQRPVSQYFILLTRRILNSSNSTASTPPSQKSSSSFASSWLAFIAEVIFPCSTSKFIDPGRLRWRCKNSVQQTLLVGKAWLKKSYPTA